VNFLGAYDEMKRICGFCPCCGELFRLSEVSLYTREAPPRTPFDRVDEARDHLDHAIERFDDQEAEIREAAKRRGQAQARKHLKRIAPFFVGRRIDPQDVKVIFSPVNYVVFRGLARDSPTAIELIDGEPITREHEKVQNSIERTIKAGNMEWHTLRIDADGRVAREE